MNESDSGCAWRKCNNVIRFQTTVERVALNYNTPQQVELERLTLDEARKYLSEGQFPPGSMGPKIEAAVEFVESGGDKAVVCRPEFVVEALEGEGGNSDRVKFTVNAK